MVKRLQDYTKIDVYADGACSQNNQKNWYGGWGVYAKHLDKIIKKYGSDMSTTNNRMELKAFINGIKEAIKLRDNNEEIVINTDSAYIYNCLTRGWYEKWRSNGWKTSKKTPVKNKMLWIELIDYWEKIPKLSVNKVRAHSNSYGNGVADQLAVKGKKEASDLDALEKLYDYLE